MVSLPLLRVGPRLGEVPTRPLREVADGGDGRRPGPIAAASAAAPVQTFDLAGVHVAKAAKGPLLEPTP